MEFGASGALRVEMSEAAHAKLELFDLSGRRLRSLADRVLDTGAHVVPWDGRDFEGRRAPPGLYFARLTVAGHRPVTTRVVLRR
jgi:flagellar hook assembly protein FlgD